MKRHFRWALAIACLFFSSANAHLDTNSLSIKGGEAFVAGNIDTITWKLTIIHMKTDFIYFSPDSQSGWQLIDSVAEKANNFQMSYLWTVPQIDSKKARIRIFQSLPAKPSEKTDDYNIISKPFSISLLPPTSVLASRKKVVENAIVSKKMGISFTVNGRVMGVRSRERLLNGKFASQKIIVH